MGQFLSAPECNNQTKRWVFRMVKAYHKFYMTHKLHYIRKVLLVPTSQKIMIKNIKTPVINIKIYVFV